MGKSRTFCFSGSLPGFGLPQIKRTRRPCQVVRTCHHRRIWPTLFDHSYKADTSACKLALDPSLPLPSFCLPWGEGRGGVCGVGQARIPFLWCVGNCQPLGRRHPGRGRAVGLMVRGPGPSPRNRRGAGGRPMPSWAVGGPGQILRQLDGRLGGNGRPGPASAHGLPWGRWPRFRWPRAGRWPSVWGGCARTRHIGCWMRPRSFVGTWPCPWAQLVWHSRGVPNPRAGANSPPNDSPPKPFPSPCIASIRRVGATVGSLGMASGFALPRQPGSTGLLTARAGGHRMPWGCG